MTNSPSPNTVNLKRWQTDQEEIRARKKRIERFRKNCYVPMARTEDWEEDLAKLTEILVREWACKLVYGGSVPDRIRPMAEAYCDLHRREVEQYVNELKTSPYS